MSISRLLLPNPLTIKANNNNVPKEITEEEKQDLKDFKESLPDIETYKLKLQTLEFFALCPNGKQIPVENICEEYLKDPNGFALRTFDDRLVLVIQAMFPDEATPYWNQAFYLSTGESSGMGGTWLPFNGILMKGNRERKITIFQPYYQHRNRTAEEKKLFFSGWFSKDELCAPQDRSYLLARLQPNQTIEEMKKVALDETYGRFYLPEGDYLYYKSRFDRFGTLSYLLASHALGGNMYKYKMGSDTLLHGFSYGNNTSRNKPSESLARYVNKNNPLQSCFQEMASTYPIAKPYEVNAYIDRHHAIFIMNAFRQENIFPPGLGFLNTPFQALGYSMPIFGDWFALAEFVHDVWYDYNIGKISLDDVRKKFTNTKEAVRNYSKKIQKDCATANEPEYTFNIPPLLRSKEHIEKYKYYGGKQTRRTRNRSKKLRKTRKH